MRSSLTNFWFCVSTPTRLASPFAQLRSCRSVRRAASAAVRAVAPSLALYARPRRGARLSSRVDTPRRAGRRRRRALGGIRAVAVVGLRLPDGVSATVTPRAIVAIIFRALRGSLPFWLARATCHSDRDERKSRGCPKRRFPLVSVGAWADSAATAARSAGGSDDRGSVLGCRAGGRAVSARCWLAACRGGCFRRRRRRCIAMSTRTRRR